MATPSVLIGHAKGVALWDNENGSGGAAYGMDIYPDKTVQAEGTGTVTVEGCFDGTNWTALKDVAGNAISLDATAGAMSVILENPALIRVVNTGGTADVVIIGTR